MDSLLRPPAEGSPDHGRPTACTQSYSHMAGLSRADSTEPSVRLPEKSSSLGLFYPFRGSQEHGLVRRESLYFIYPLRDAATQK